jgi:hypothetical protein
VFPLFGLSYSSCLLPSYNFSNHGSADFTMDAAAPRSVSGAIGFFLTLAVGMVRMDGFYVKFSH